MCRALSEADQALREREPAAPAAAPLPTADEVAAEGEAALVCRACSATVSSERWLFSMRAPSPVQVFPNPHGIMLEIMTLEAAWGLRFESWASTDFTWFAGYAWRIVYCHGCAAHLGWRFEGSGAPSTFFGLLTKAVGSAPGPSEPSGS